MNYLKRISVPALLMAWCVYFIISAGSPSKKGNTFVWAVFVLLLIVFAAELYNEFRRAKAEAKEQTDAPKEKKDNTGLIRSGILFGATVLYVVLMQVLGFMISTFAYLVSMFLFLKAKNKLAVAVASVALTALMWFAFDHILGVPLPSGIFM